jgi:hypothetical protein
VRAYRDVLWKKRKEMIKEWSNIDPVIAAGTALRDDCVVLATVEPNCSSLTTTL